MLRLCLCIAVLAATPSIASAYWHDGFLPSSKSVRMAPGSGKTIGINLKVSEDFDLPSRDVGTPDRKSRSRQRTAR